MSDDIEFLADRFKKMSELKAYAEAQYKTIIQLTERIRSLENQNKHLEDLLQGKVPPLSLDGNVSEEELICEAQLRILRDKATRQELTLEEARRLEIYVKILDSKQKKINSFNAEVRKLDDKELLSLIDDKK